MYVNDSIVEFIVINIRMTWEDLYRKEKKFDEEINQPKIYESEYIWRCIHPVNRSQLYSARYLIQDMSADEFGVVKVSTHMQTSTFAAIAAIAAVSYKNSIDHISISRHTNNRQKCVIVYTDSAMVNAVFSPTLIRWHILDELYLSGWIQLGVIDCIHHSTEHTCTCDLGLVKIHKAHHHHHHHGMKPHNSYDNNKYKWINKFTWTCISDTAIRSTCQSIDSSEWAASFQC